MYQRNISKGSTTPTEVLEGVERKGDVIYL